MTLVPKCHYQFYVFECYYCENNFLKYIEIIKYFVAPIKPV